MSHRIGERETSRGCGIVQVKSSIVVVLVRSGLFQVVDGLERAFDDVALGNDGTVPGNGAFHDAPGEGGGGEGGEEGPPKECVPA
jgi:hypothetical protein